MTEIDITLSADEMSELIGEQLILEGDAKPFGYLAGLSFDGMTNNYDIVEILIEYIENEETFNHLTGEQIAEIERLLRGKP